MPYALIYSVSYRKMLREKEREVSKEWRKELGECENMEDIWKVGMTFISQKRNK